MTDLSRIYSPQFCAKCGDPLAWWAQVKGLIWCVRCRNECRS